MSGVVSILKYVFTFLDMAKVSGCFRKVLCFINRIVCLESFIIALLLLCVSKVPQFIVYVLHLICFFFAAMINTRFISKLLLFLVVLSNFSSIYFAYILYFILYDLCIVCVSIYVVNAVMLIYAYTKFKLVNNLKNKNKVE